ncbi:MAG: hypothetical protein Q8R88_16825, partial [Desulfoprunum sp.]|nr:hypothetical protein [Desulfoprunum sp.]
MNLLEVFGIVTDQPLEKTTLIVFPNAVPFLPILKVVPPPLLFGAEPVLEYVSLWLKAAVSVVTLDGSSPVPVVASVLSSLLPQPFKNKASKRMENKLQILFI